MSDEKIKKNQWLIILLRIAVIVWAVVLLANFVWSEFSFFANRVEPFLKFLGL